MKKMITTSLMCLLMIAGLSLCKGCQSKWGYTVMYDVYVVNEHHATKLDSIGIGSLVCSLVENNSTGIQYCTEQKDTTWFHLYEKDKVIYDTGLVLFPTRSGFFVERDSTFMLKLTLRADSTLAVEQKLLTHSTQESLMLTY